MSAFLSWTDVEAVVRIADADPDPELREVARETLAWMPLDQTTGRHVLELLADEAPELWRHTLDHHLWLLRQEPVPTRPETSRERADEAMTALVLLPDHMFDGDDVMDLSVLCGLPDTPSRWLLTALLRRLVAAPVDEADLEVAVSRIRRLIDILPDAARAEVVLEAQPNGDRRRLVGAALAVARPADVLAALLPWLKSPNAGDRLVAVHTLLPAARFLGQSHLFGTSTAKPLDALADLADLLRRSPGLDAQAPVTETPRTAPEVEEEPSAGEEPSGVAASQAAPPVDEPLPVEEPAEAAESQDSAQDAPAAEPEPLPQAQASPGAAVAFDQDVQSTRADASVEQRDTEAPPPPVMARVVYGHPHDPIGWSWPSRPAREPAPRSVPRIPQVTPESPGPAGREAIARGLWPFGRKRRPPAESAPHSVAERWPDTGDARGAGE